VKVLVTSSHPGLFRKGLEWVKTGELSLRSLFRVLDEAGHAYEFRPVVPGEVLDEYDALIVEMSSAARTWGAGHLLGSIWCFAQDRPSIAFYDDWNVRSADGAIRQLAGNPNLMFEGFIRYRNADSAEPHRQALERALAGFFESDGPKRVIAGFAWGDKALISDHPFDLVFDPSTIMLQEPFLPQPIIRERRWVLATWENRWGWAAKLHHRWPFEEYGKQKYGKSKLPLPQLCERYAVCWGAVVPPYYHAGSGFWRTRLVHMAQARSLFALDPRDAIALGDPFATDWITYEELNDNELSAIAESHATAFWKRSWTMDRVVREMTNFLETLT